MKRPRKPVEATTAPEVRELGDDRSFLDVLRETCAREAGRYTLGLVSGGVDHTVLVDRGGPFNATGGGLAGSPALVNACRLRSGRSSITVGWPVDQPLYQPGLDVTMKNLVAGTAETPGLPRPRGVESLRNSDWHVENVGQPAPDTASPGDSIASPTDDPAVGKLPAARQGTARQIATRALLWLVECEDPSRYNLEQAAMMARQGLAAGISQMLRPFRKDLDQRISRVKQDWEKSGEVAAEATRKKRARSVPVSDDQDREFRLR